MKILGYALLSSIIFFLFYIGFTTYMQEKQRLPLSAYVPPPNVTVVKGGGPLECDFSALNGNLATSILIQDDKAPQQVQVPSAYIFGPFHSSVVDGSNGTLLFEAQVDTFMPSPKHDGRKRTEQETVERNNASLTLLVNDIRPLDDIRQFMVENISGEPEGTKFAEVAQVNGLKKIDIAPKESPFEADLFVSYEGTKLSDVINCNLLPKPNDQFQTIPQCNHNFTTPAGLDIEISYARTHLDSWKTIRDNAIKFLTCIVGPMPSSANAKP